ncbi:hypothetical protein HYR54_05845 [Candidatus Acetothermia bacterium]|nr:hypothetical protein [Candidatus Acetothermia bacterium]
MLLDDFLPIYHFHEVHERRMRTSPDRIFRAIKELTPAEISLFRLLMGIRSLPARLTGKGRLGLIEARPLLDQVLNRGFVLLAEETDRELVVGTVGQFWKLRGSSSPKLADAQEFVAFDQPDYAKVAMNFYLEEWMNTGAVHVRTETRIFALDPEARQKFTRYWCVIYPGSALIRREWLRAIQQRAERG